MAEEQSPLSVCIPAVVVACASPGAGSALGGGSLWEQWLQEPELVSLLCQHCRTRLGLLPELQVGCGSPG